MKCTRCGKPVDEHEAGAATDACFAEVVMGLFEVRIRPDGQARYMQSHEPYLQPAEQMYQLTSVKAYSTDIAAAWAGLEHWLAESEWHACDFGYANAGAGLWYGALQITGQDRFDVVGDGNADTAPLAIVRACMKAVISERASG